MAPFRVGNRMLDCRSLTAELRVLRFVLSQVSNARPFDFAQGRLWGTHLRAGAPLHAAAAGGGNDAVHAEILD